MQTDVVLRTLVDAALSGRRSWKNVTELAVEASAGEKLAYKTVAKAASIGAITRHAGGGFSTTDPERLLAILSARRTLTPSRRTTFTAAQSLLERLPAYAIGGTRAAAHHLGERNTIANHGPAVVYVREGVPLDALPEGDEALILTADTRAMRAWSEGYTSKAQTYADLFAQPGWQASEFRRALWREWFAADDWAQAEMSDA